MLVAISIQINAPPRSNLHLFITQEFCTTRNAFGHAQKITRLGDVAIMRTHTNKYVEHSFDLTFRMVPSTSNAISTVFTEY